MSYKDWDLSELQASGSVVPSSSRRRSAVSIPQAWLGQGVTRTSVGFWTSVGARDRSSRRTRGLRTRAAGSKTVSAHGDVALEIETDLTELQRLQVTLPLRRERGLALRAARGAPKAMDRGGLA